MLAFSTQTYADLGWFTAYENDSLGGNVSGSIAALVEALESGADVKIIRVSDSEEYLIGAILEWTEINYDQAGNPVVAGEFKTISLSHNSDGTDSPHLTNAYWVHIVVNTTGNVFYARYYMDGTHHSDSSYNWNMKWLVKY